MCKKPSRVSPTNHTNLDANLIFFKSTAFANSISVKLSEAIQIDTVSYDKSENKFDEKKFFAFHDYLEKAFPLMYLFLPCFLSQEIVTKTWKNIS